MTDEKRPYRMRRRAELEEETRLRITESAVALHGILGPSRTSMSAVAEHAGVRRSTVYRHFPDEDALSTRAPRTGAPRTRRRTSLAWAAIEDPDERLRAGSASSTRYYRPTEAMIANLLRDERAVPVVGELFRAYRGLLAAAADVLMAGRRRRRATRARRSATRWRSRPGARSRASRASATPRRRG